MAKLYAYYYEGQGTKFGPNGEVTQEGIWSGGKLIYEGKTRQKEDGNFERHGYGTSFEGENQTKDYQGKWDSD